MTRFTSMLLILSALGLACSQQGSAPAIDGGAESAAPDAQSTPQLPDASPEPPDAASPDAAPAPLTFAACFADAFVTPPDFGLDYDQFEPIIGSHCLGTRHQTITGVERVVFLGDSVTVGTPPTADADTYRARLADALAERFGLEPPGALWKAVNLIDGNALVRESGDFASCAKYGARIDDLIRDNTQIEDCIPESERSKRTLVIMTIGGNDISALTKNGVSQDGAPPKSIPELWAQTEEFVGLLRDAVSWFTEDPTRFPNGVYVVFGNLFEFTDATADVASCPAAGIAGFSEPWDDPDALADMVVWANEQFLSIAVETGTDMIFNLEHFCGHGFHHDDPLAPCYRGPGTERWYDETCIHPNPTGHAALADMFMSVIEGE